MCFNRRRIPKHLLLQPSPPPRQASRPLLKWILGALLVLFAVAVADIARAELEPGEAQAGRLLFKQAAGYSAAVHHKSEANVTIKGMLARVVLRQTFENTSADWVEGVYVFPLPESAAVNRMVMEIGERRIVASIKEKQEAKRIYEQAKSDGKRAALTAQQRPNLFTQSIANIGPQQKITIELHYNEVISYRNATFAWRLPTTLTPRYIPGIMRQDEDTRVAMEQHSGWGWAQPTDQVPDAHLITPFIHPAPTAMTNPITINISLDAGIPLPRIRGSYHELSIYKLGETHQITTTQKTIPMDRDFEMTWQTVSGKAPDAAFFSERIDGDDYALLMVVPPQQTGHTQALPREVIFIVDTSGSMAGTSIQQAKASLSLALSRLTNNDRFNVIEFNSYHQALFAAPKAADTRALQQAQSFVQRLNADGGTEMAPALEEALRYPAVKGYLKQVIFITDGSVGNEAALFELIHQQLGDARLFTVGIGSAPNSYFMTKAAEFGRGTFTFIGAQSEVATRMQELFTKLESPVMSDIVIQWPANLAVEAWPQRIPDLYHGEPLLVSVKIVGGLPHQGVIDFSGQQAGSTWSRKLAMANKHPATEQQSGIAVRWARDKIAALLDERVRGRAEDEVREAVLEVALQHQLLSPYTSFVAVEETVSRLPHEPLAQAPVANLLPQGQVANPLMYPRTATSMLLNMLLGTLALLLLITLRRLDAGSSRHG